MTGAACFQIHSRGLLCSVLLVLCGSFCSADVNAAEQKFNRDIRPIFSEHCYACHGPDAGNRKADLRLDARDAAIAARAIVPGDADRSLIMERIMSSDPDVVMPPPDAHKVLTAVQKESIRAWINAGAEYQNHWSYEVPRKVDVPAGAHPIDYLVSQRLRAVGLQPSPEADRRVLARRLSFDLLGLPPTPEAVMSFLSDQSPDACERLIDELLASPHFGERMALGWLDAVRYADTIGYHSDNPRNIWPYRDWVIRSFNDNKPFDRFTLEQIAGDLLPDASQETRVGSAFNRLLLTTEEGGAQARDYESRMLTDRVRAIGTAWLGQTTGCAQCHDHKFDPITTKDFYALGAFFADIEEKPIGRREDGMAVLTVEEQTRLRELESVIAVAKQASDQEAMQAAETSRRELLAKAPRCLVSTSSVERRIVRILPRGNWMDESGEVVKPAIPHYLPQPDISDRELNRLDLAEWLVSRDNPLTARVVMNRLWKQFFGAALSRTPDDLGAQGEMPPNQPLLDWMACELMDSGWNMKHMIRLMVTSRTYQQTSVPTAAHLTKDPDNREHARQSRFRLDAELIRDNALAVSGLLTRSIGGPAVKPYQPAGYWDNLNFPNREYVPDSGENQYRRGLYVWWQRSFLHPSLMAFDAPGREECIADRGRSNIPQQALTLLNDPTYVEAFRQFALRAMETVKSQDNAKDADRVRIAWMFQQALQRAPSEAETNTLLRLLEQQRTAHRLDEPSAAIFLKIGQGPVPDGVDRIELAAWTHVARVLLNLHEFITRN